MTEATELLEFDVSIPSRKFDIAFELPMGRVLGIIGPNGAGKSTIAGALAGTVAPTSGRISVRDRVLTDTATGTYVPIHQRKVGLLAQDPLLFPHLSVIDNLTFAPKSQGSPDAQKVAEHWLRKLELEPLSHRKPHELSGGQAQRVALGRAFAGSPDILCLDEPFRALDITVAADMRALLYPLLHKMTVLLITHDVLDIMYLADDVAVIEHGRLVRLGTTDDVIEKPLDKFTARFSGTNIIKGRSIGNETLRSGSGEILVTGKPGHKIPAGQRAIASFRPTAVSILTDHTDENMRNQWPATIKGLEQGAGTITVICDVKGDSIRAEISPASAAQLSLVTGNAIIVAVKAQEIELYPAH